MDIDAPDIVKTISRIFMPYATKRREDFINQKGRFVHYTSAENAIKIVQSEQFWMRNAKCMNDYMEVAHGYEQLHKFFSAQKNEASFFEALNHCGDEIGQKTIKLFNQWWDKIEFNIFMSAISEHDKDENAYGRLSMWRAYGQHSAKAAIVLNIPLEPDDATAGLSVFLSPVAYFSYERVERELMSVIENINNNTEFLRSIDDHAIIDMMFMTLVMTAASLKHEGFREEKEWRVIYLPDLYPSKLMQSDIETVGGVPQKVFKIPLKDNPKERVTGVSIPQLVERVIIGPSEYPLALLDAFYVALKKAGIDDPESRVVYSGIPLRT